MPPNRSLRELQPHSEQQRRSHWPPLGWRAAFAGSKESAPAHQALQSLEQTHDTTEYFDEAKSTRVVFPNLKPSTQTISLRLPAHLLDGIKAAANSRDVPYQSLIKVWLQEKLQQRSG